MTRGSIVRYAGLLVLVALVATVLATGWWRLLTPADLESHYREVENLVRLNPALGIAAFAAVSAAVTAACLPATGVLVVVGGALFGGVEGGAAALVGSVVGSTGLFLACRAASNGRFAAMSGGTLGRIMDTVSRHAFSTLLVLRLTPVAPLSVVTIAAGLARVNLAPFVAASLIGSAPSNFIYAALGAGLRHALDRGASLDPRMLADPRLIAPLFALALLAAAGALVSARRRP